MNAILSALCIVALVGFFMWALCRVFDRNCDSSDFGYSPAEFANRQAKKLQRNADKELNRRPRLRTVRFFNF